MSESYLPYLPDTNTVSFQHSKTEKVDPTGLYACGQKTTTGRSLGPVYIELYLHI